MAALLMAAVLLIGACSAAAPAPDGSPDTPVAPVLSLTMADATSVTVSWDVPDTNPVVSNYELRWRRGSDSDSDWDSADSASVESTKTSHTITDLDPETAYQVQVRARFTSGGESPWSQTLPATTKAAADDPDTGDPGTGDPGTDDPGTGDPGTGDPGTGDPGTDPTTTTPTQVQGAPDVDAGPVTTTSVIVLWTPPQTTLEISGYELRWRTSGGAWTDVVGIPPTDMSRSITGLNPGTGYEIQVRAVFMPDGESPWSGTLMTATTASGPVDPNSVEITIEPPRDAEVSEDRHRHGIVFTLNASKQSTTNLAINIRVTETGGPRLLLPGSGTETGDYEEPVILEPGDDGRVVLA